MKPYQLNEPSLMTTDFTSEMPVYFKRRSLKDSLSLKSPKLPVYSTIPISSSPTSAMSSNSTSVHPKLPFSLPLTSHATFTTHNKQSGKVIPSLTYHLKKLADSFSLNDVKTWTSLIEISRHLKQTLMGKNIDLWPTWYNTLQIPERESNQFISASPILSPGPLMGDILNRSPSPLQDNEASDSDTEFRRFRRKANLSISTGPSSPNTKYINTLRASPYPPSDSSDSGSTCAFVRSQSDGDLFGYVKGFLELKQVLQNAREILNLELSKIIEELEKYEISSNLSGMSAPLLKAGPSLKLILPTSKSKMISKERRNSGGSISQNSNTVVKKPSDVDSVLPIQSGISETLVNHSESSSLNEQLLSRPVETSIDCLQRGQVGALRAICQQIQESDLNQLMNPSVCRSFISRLMVLNEEWENIPGPSPLSVLAIFSGINRLVEHIEEDTWMWTYELIFSNSLGICPEIHSVKNLKKCSLPSVLRVFPAIPKLLGLL